MNEEDESANDAETADEIDNESQLENDSNETETEPSETQNANASTSSHLRIIYTVLQFSITATAVLKMFSALWKRTASHRTV